MDEATLETLAEEELLREAKRGAARADVSGPSGWQKCPLPSTNKRFLRNTILHTLHGRQRPVNTVASTSDATKRRGESGRDSKDKRGKKMKTTSDGGTVGFSGASASQRGQTTDTKVGGEMGQEVAEKRIKSVEVIDLE